MTLRSIHNNTNIPLKPFGVFTGQWEPTSTYLEISTYINSSAYLAVSLQQSQDANSVVINTTYNYTPTDDVTVYNTSVGLPFYRVILNNEADIQIAYMALTTILTAVPSTIDVNGGSVVVSGTVAVSSVAGVVTSTLANNPAQLRTMPLVVGHWYSVASAGDTPGAVWNEMGAIVGGESIPPVGRQFQCLYAGYGTGTAYDITAPVNATATANVNVTNLPIDTAGNVKVLDSGVYKPTDNGISSSFEITASAVNNAVVYYADETKGVDVAGGWEFTSVNAGARNTQINWYMYQPTSDVIITDLSNNPTNSYYTIIDNVGVEFPMIYVYTKPTIPATKTTGGTSGSSWYQSKFVYQANQAGSVGTYLLYAGANPTTIRPDLVHINLRQLDILCLGTLQPDEIVLYAALLTSSNLASPAGNFSLTMSKFGVVISPVDTTLRTDSTGALVASVSGEVSLSSTINNNVKINPTAVLAVRTQGLSNTALQIYAASIIYGNSLINKSAVVPCWVKFYSKATAPTSADTPFMIQYLENVVQYNLISHNDSFYNMPIASGLWVRATLTSADNDTTDTGIDCEVTTFLGAV